MPEIRAQRTQNRDAAFYALGVVTILNFLNYIDRYILAAVLPRVKAELVLTDFQLGLLANAFLVAYFVTSPVFGVLGDRLARPLANSVLLETHKLDTWRETFRVNVDGTMLCCRAAIHAMRQRGYGTIVNIGSVSGVLPYATGAAYAASKAAVAMLTRALSLEVGRYGITVNCIAPGSIRHRAGGDPEAEAPNIPMGYHGRPSDVAEMVAFLASNAGRYITGATLVLDGGATTGRPRAR